MLITCIIHNVQRMQFFVMTDNVSNLVLSALYIYFVLQSISELAIFVMRMPSLYFFSSINVLQTSDPVVL